MIPVCLLFQTLKLLYIFASVKDFHLGILVKCKRVSKVLSRSLTVKMSRIHNLAAWSVCVFYLDLPWVFYPDFAI